MDKQAVTALARTRSSYRTSLGGNNSDIYGVKSDPFNDYIGKYFNKWPGFSKGNYEHSEINFKRNTGKINRLMNLQSKARRWEQARNNVKTAGLNTFSTSPVNVASGPSNISNTWRYNPMLPKLVGLAGGAAGAYYGYKKKGIKGAILGSLLTGLGSYGLATASNRLAAGMGRV